LHFSIFSIALKQSEFLAEPDGSVLYADFYVVFSGFGENEKLGDTVTDLQGF
jgi:hypothetical protein